MNRQSSNEKRTTLRVKKNALEVCMTKPIYKYKYLCHTYFNAVMTRTRCVSEGKKAFWASLFPIVNTHPLPPMKKGYDKNDFVHTSYPYENRKEIYYERVFIIRFTLSPSNKNSSGQRDDSEKWQGVFISKKRVC